MPPRPKVGETVQTPFGKGIIREVRNNGRLVVGIKERAFVVADDDVSSISRVRRGSRSKSAATVPRDPLSAFAGRAALEIDLHGLTVDEALARVEQGLSDAMLDDLAELRLVHGRSGGRIRAALHRRLREIKSVRGFAVDPRNRGVTIVRL